MLSVPMQEVSRPVDRETRLVPRTKIFFQILSNLAVLLRTRTLMAHPIRMPISISAEPANPIREPTRASLAWPNANIGALHLVPSTPVIPTDSTPATVLVVKAFALAKSGSADFCIAFQARQHGLQKLVFVWMARELLFDNDREIFAQCDHSNG
jgi:hypothetical protein